MNIQIGYTFGGFRAEPALPDGWDARTAEIANRLQAGETLEQIGERFGVTRSRIQQIAKKAGIVWSRKMEIAGMRKEQRRIDALARRAVKKAADEARIGEVRKLVDGGMSIAKAGAALGFTRGQVQLLARGWPSRHGRWRPDLGEKKAAACEAYRNGSTLQEAADATGLSIFTVSHAVKRAGIPLRRKGRRAGQARPRIKPEPRPKLPRETLSVVAAGKRPPRGREWTADHLVTLRDGWAAGKSASAIAADLGPGFTRNAVLGKVFRMRRARP